MDEPSETMLSWFEDDELTDCPSCGERKIVPSHLRDGLAVCAACGVVAKPTPTSSQAARGRAREA
jgi:uncharacterized Zn finger protein